MPLPFDGTPGESYRPSNGTEGDLFMAQYCHRCELFDGQHCDRSIIGYAMLFTRGDDHYPDQWKYDENGRPTCTAFERAPTQPDRRDDVGISEAKVIAPTDEEE